MPYIENRNTIDGLLNLLRPALTTKGEVNYAITKIVHEWILGFRLKNYETLSKGYDVLSEAAQEYYRSVLGKYEDKWIAIIDSEVVSSGESGKKVFKEARAKYPNNKPLLLKVPSSTVMLL